MNARTPPTRRFLSASVGYSLLVLGVFLVTVQLRDILDHFDFYADLFDRYSYHIPNGLVKVLWVVICLAAIALTYRASPRQVLAELGLWAPVGRAWAFALLVTLPMLLVGVTLSHWNPEATWLGVLHLSLVSSFAEELLFRGYAFGQLYRRAGWKFLPAVLVTAVVFAVAHVIGGSDMSVMTFVGTLAITGIGGILFAWLFVRWDDNLWVPIGIHVMMNLYWDVFALGDGPVGAWPGTVAQLVTVILAIVLTVYRGRIRKPAATTMPETAS